MIKSDFWQQKCCWSSSICAQEVGAAPWTAAWLKTVGRRARCTHVSSCSVCDVRRDPALLRRLVLDLSCWDWKNSRDQGLQGSCGCCCVCRLPWPGLPWNQGWLQPIACYFEQKGRQPWACWAEKKIAPPSQKWSVRVDCHKRGFLSNGKLMHEFESPFFGGLAAIIQ